MLRLAEALPFLLLTVSLALAGCNNPGEDVSKGEAPTTGLQEPVKPGEPEPAAVLPKDGEEVAVLETNHGRIVFKFFPDLAPKHVESFKSLTNKGFYDSTTFHRVIPGFMIQGGDPNSKDNDRMNDGMGDAGYTIPAEFSDKAHDRGIVSAARSQDPNSAGSQFFIVVARSPHLDRQYSVFGQVVEGMDVVDKIVALPRDRRDNPWPDNPAVVKKASIQKWPLPAGEAPQKP